MRGYLGVRLGRHFTTTAPPTTHEPIGKQPLVAQLEQLRRLRLAQRAPLHGRTHPSHKSAMVDPQLRNGCYGRLWKLWKLWKLRNGCYGRRVAGRLWKLWEWLWEVVVGQHVEQNDVVIIVAHRQSAHLLPPAPQPLGRIPYHTTCVGIPRRRAARPIGHRPVGHCRRGGSIAAQLVAPDDMVLTSALVASGEEAAA